MDSQILLSVKFLGESKLIGLNASSSYDEFKLQVLGKWGHILGVNFTCLCAAGDISSLCLDSDLDIQNLLLLCQISDLKIVYVDISSFPEAVSNPACTPALCDKPHQTSGSDVSKAGSSSNKENFISPAGNSNNVTSGKYIEFGGVDNLPCYDMCPALKEKTLLSDHWAELMKGGVGSVFRGGAAEFRTVVIKYSTQMGFIFKYKRNDGKYITVVCNEPSNQCCDWFIKARRQPITLCFEIMEANFVHKCVGRLTNIKSRRFGSNIIGELVLDTLKNDPNANGKEIRKELKFSYGIEVPYWKAHRAAEVARKHIFGDFDESYDQLRWYCEAIQRTNPGSIVALESDPISHEFIRLFIAFDACIKGFRACRPLLFVDGTFMKGRAEGTLLVATAKDGDNSLFPVAFAVVSAENTENWTWFLSLLRDNINHAKKIYYLSDRNLGLMKAFKDVFTEKVHFFCLFHLQMNLKNRMSKKWTTIHRELFASQFNDCAYAPNKRIFKDKLQIFKDTGGVIADKWLTDLPPENWAVAYSPMVTRYGEMTSNAAESFNAWIIDSISLPITHMVDDIRCKISSWFVERRQDINSWSDLLVPSKNSLWHYLADASRTWYVSQCPAGDHQVSSTPSVRVHLDSRSCSCHKWQVTGFPCAHAVAVICRTGGDVSNYIEECFFTSSYKECYSSDLNPVPDTERFEYTGEFGDTKILKPMLNRPPGRPPKKRKPSCGKYR